MLNERERQALADIETGLRDEATESMDNRSERPGRLRHPVAVVTSLAVLLPISVWLGVMAAGPPAGIAAGLTIGAGLAGLLLQDRVGAQTSGPDVDQLGETGEDR